MPNHNGHSLPARSVPPVILENLPESRSPWHLTPRERRVADAWSDRKDRLLRWVVAAMPRVLTTREQTYISLRYFKGESCARISAQLHVGESTIHRAIRRGVCKLRREARRDVTWRYPD